MSGRLTRKSKRLASLSETVTTLPTVVPIFSQSIAVRTSITSEVDDEVSIVAAAKSRTSKSENLSARFSSRSRGELSKNKRPATINDDSEGNNVEALRGQKRRAVSSQVYVSIPSRSKNQSKESLILKPLETSF